MSRYTLSTNRPVLIMAFVALLLAGCSSLSPFEPTSSETVMPEQITLYNWPDYMPQSVLDAFHKEFGTSVRVDTYDFSEQAVASIRDGSVYDLAVLETQHIPSLIADGLLAELDRRNLPNSRNLSAAFRDLAYDPGNRHSIPFHWGTTGLLVRTDLVRSPITRWSDLWDPDYRGKVGLWALPRDVIAIALKSLNYSINSEDPEELEAAYRKLLDLKENAFFMDLNLGSSAGFLDRGEAAFAVGWSYDMLETTNGQVQYVLPDEGTILWADAFVVPANSPNKTAAERFVDFVLRPEISASIINETSYPMPNDAALPLVDASLASNTTIFPDAGALKNAEIILPLSTEGQQRIDMIWARFLADGGALEIRMDD